MEATYRLRIPTPGEYRLLAGPFNENGRIPDKNFASFERALAARALVGWRGVSLKDIDGSGAGALPYTEDAVKLLMVSFDSTLKANLSVGMPLDLMVIERDAFVPLHERRIEQSDPYFAAISDKWGEALRTAFHSLPDYTLD